MRASGIRFYGKGGPTLGNRELGGRKEPDDSYDIGAPKTVPDIAIEVVITSGGIDTLEFYKRLGSSGSLVLAKQPVISLLLER